MAATLYTQQSEEPEPTPIDFEAYGWRDLDEHPLTEEEEEERATMYPSMPPQKPRRPLSNFLGGEG